MALINCSECKHIISTKSKICPQCGNKTPKKLERKQILMIISIILILVIGASCFFVHKRNIENKYIERYSDMVQLMYLETTETLILTLKRVVYVANSNENYGELLDILNLNNRIDSISHFIDEQSAFLSNPPEKYKREYELYHALHVTFNAHIDEKNIFSSTETHDKIIKIYQEIIELQPKIDMRDNLSSVTELDEISSWADEILAKYGYSMDEDRISTTIQK